MLSGGSFNCLLLLLLMLLDLDLWVGLVLAGPDRELSDELHLRIRLIKQILLRASLGHLLLMLRQELPVDLIDVGLGSRRILL